MFYIDLQFFLDLFLYNFLHLFQVCWWSHKITLYDINEETKEEKVDEGGPPGSNVSHAAISESEADSDDSDDWDDDMQPQLKKMRLSSAETSTHT